MVRCRVRFFHDFIDFFPVRSNRFRVNQFNAHDFEKMRVFYVAVASIVTRRSNRI